MPERTNLNSYKMDRGSMDYRYGITSTDYPNRVGVILNTAINPKKMFNPDQNIL